MSMNPENQEFESLRRLLKLKRYEQPPPRYFNDFSTQVISRIQSGEVRGRESAASTIENRPSWLLRLLGAMEMKPILAGAFGTVIVGILVGAAVYSEKTTMPGTGGGLAAQEMQLPLEPTPLPGVGHGGVLALGATNSGGPISIFDSIRTPDAQLTSGRPFGAQ